MIRISDIPCRDPFILRHDGQYYLYRSDDVRGIQCFVSADLEHWADPVYVYTPSAELDASGDYFWAPECHYYNGRFYIFTSVRSARYGRRRISVYRAAHPLGPFEDIAGGITDPTWDAIDGTLYVDADGAPWMVFVHEWTSLPDRVGTIEAARLSEDLTRFVSDPVTLFRANEPVWATWGVTDGPFLYTTAAGDLLMTWSNFTGKDDYVVALARSVTGKITGPWVHEEQPLYARDGRPSWQYDGGHAMIFRDHEDRPRIVFHAPNQADGGVCECVMIGDVEEDGHTIRIR